MSLGGLDEIMETTEQKAEIVPMEEVKKKRKPFHFWNVNGTDYKMKLQTGMIAKLEDKYRRNLLNIISDDGIPPLSVMLTVAQAALSPWHHNVTYQVVEKLYDSWMEHNEGNQVDFLSKVIIPTMAVSGFFTPSQAEEIVERLENVTNLL